MPDHLHLSLWMSSASPALIPAYFKQALAEFPFSRLRPGAVLRVYALDFNEAPLIERMYPAGTAVEEIAGDAAEFFHEDSAFQLETWWDLWQFTGGWELRPSVVSLKAYGPEFPAELGAHLEFDLGPESAYLLPPAAPGSLRPVQSNLKSILRLARDLDRNLPVARKIFWSESGEDFSTRLETLLA